MSALKYPQFKDKNVLSGISRDDTIYKFFPLKYLPTLVGGTLRLDPVTSWEDVYELFLLRQHFQTADGTAIGVDDLAGGFFGQSWTLCPESDAMWRIYSQWDGRSNSLDGISVRLRTTVGRLFDALYTSDSSMANTWIGRVNYLPQADINTRITQIASKPVSASHTFRDLVIESALTKRTEFAHEQEVRPIFWGDHQYVTDRILNTAPVGSRIFAPFQIDFHKLIDQVTIDPRLNRDASIKTRGKLIAMGIRSSIIDQSALYRLPAPTTITFS